MSGETVAIFVRRYRTPSGKHTCVARVPSHVCALYRIRRFGTEEYCGWAGDLLERNDEGYLQPCEDCPIREHAA